MTIKDVPAVDRLLKREFAPVVKFEDDASGKANFVGLNLFDEKFLPLVDDVD